MREAEKGNFRDLVNLGTSITETGGNGLGDVKPGAGAQRLSIICAPHLFWSCYEIITLYVLLLSNTLVGRIPKVSK
jgi:hypothetical protein